MRRYLSGFRSYTEFWYMIERQTSGKVHNDFQSFTNIEFFCSPGNSHWGLICCQQGSSLWSLWSLFCMVGFCIQAAPLSHVLHCIPAFYLFIICLLLPKTLLEFNWSHFSPLGLKGRSFVLEQQGSRLRNINKNTENGKVRWRLWQALTNWPCRSRCFAGARASAPDVIFTWQL